MKTLYFDVDGTLTVGSAAKPRLAGGAFEEAVRAAGFERLVCVSQLCDSIRSMALLRPEVDEKAALMAVCRGAFVDADWFKAAVSLSEEPERRAHSIDMSGDWWYVDDMADTYFFREGMEEEYSEHIGRRIHKAARGDDGQGILIWLASC